MNIQVALEKKQLECSEGMNHLLIHLCGSDISEIDNFQLHLTLPKGINALKNLNHLIEDTDHTVTILHLHEDTDLIFELFTGDRIPLDQLLITVTLSYRLRSQLYESKKRVPLMIVSEEISDQIMIDSEIASRVAKIKSESEKEPHSFVSLPVLQQLENEHSPLEEKYRIQSSYEIIQ
ncbi:MAG: hypothetical protein ACE3JK_05920 [Sporolactobacillus sp.]